MSTTDSMINGGLSWTGIEVQLEPWKVGVEVGLEMINLYEEVGGKPSTGTIVLSFVPPSSKEINSFIKEKFLDVKNGKIILTSTNKDTKFKSLKIPFVIYNRGVNLNKVTLSVYCGKTDVGFLKTQHMTYNNIKDAIEYSSFSKIIPSDLLPDSNVSNRKLVQIQESNLDFCNKCCGCYRKDLAFGHGFEGIIMNDLKAVKKDSAYEIVLGNDFESLNFPSLIYSLAAVTPEDDKSEESGSSQAGHVLKLTENSLVHKNYSGFASNLMYNLGRTSQYFSETSITCHHGIPNYRIGDIVKLNRVKENGGTLERLEDNYVYYMVKSNHFFLAGPKSEFRDDLNRTFGFTSTLVGLKEGFWNYNN